MFTSSRKCICLAVVIVALTLPHLSNEFGLKDEEQKAPLVGRTAKRFKFHKLEKVVVSDDDETLEEEADEGETADTEDYQEERHKPIFKVKPPKKDDGNNDEGDGGGFFSFFGFGKSEPAAPAPPPAPEEKSNGIINWIMSIKELLGSAQEEAPPAPESMWNLYFNRWPFNSFFPIGKPKKPIYVPHKRTPGPVEHVEPMSQEHFESLLHTVPGFVVNASHVSHVECKQQLQIFHHQLRGNKLWTLQMLDSTAKITSGLLRGNINQFGDYELCTNIRTVVKVTPEVKSKIKGKYCLAHIETQAAIDELRVPVHMAHGRGLWNSHLGNPQHFAPRYSVANWGICVPNLCPASVVQEMIETNLRPYNTTGVNFRIEVSDENCYERSSQKFSKLIRKDSKVRFTVGYLAIFVIAVNSILIVEHYEFIKSYVSKGTAIVSRLFECVRDVVGTLIADLKERINKLKATEEKEEGEGGGENEDGEETKPAEEEVEPVVEEQDQPKEDGEEVAEDTENAESAQEETGPPPLKVVLKDIFYSFSPQRSLNELISQDKPDVQFPLFHLLRIVATVMLYFCLKFLMIGHLPLSNRDKLVKSLDQPLTIVFRSPMIYMDVLLIISGFLASYHMSEEMEQKSHIFVLKRITGKILRSLPTLYAVIFFQTWILPHLGSGPLWGSLIMQNSRICEQNMWRNFFGVQNAIEFEETCSPMTIQLALELQLFILGPLIVWLYYVDVDAGFLVYGAIHAMSVAARFSRTNLEHLSSTHFHGMNVSKFYRTANILYSSPISRATPYLIGIGAGILYRSTDGIIEMSKFTEGMSWSIAAIGIFWCFWNPSYGTNLNFIYNSTVAASYASWAPLILGMCVAMIIFLMPKGESSLNGWLTSKPVLVLSRISFPMQLVSFAVVLFSTAEIKESTKYYLSDMISPREIGIILLISICLAFFIDVPMQNVRKILVNRLFIERPPHEEEESHGEEEEHADEISDQSGESKPKTPEPPEDIWGSDPEEEERKYMARRTSRVSFDLGTKPVAEEAPTDGNEAESEADESNKQPETEEAEEEEEEEITEEEEVLHRPVTPEEPPKPEPPTQRRRRWTAEEA